MIRRLLPVVMAVLLAAAPARSDAPAPCEALAHASDVFVGVVVELSEIALPDAGPQGKRSRAMPRPATLGRFRVEESMLGTGAPEHRLVDARGRGEPPLREGERYLVYASTAAGAERGDCLHAVPLAEAAEHLRYLRAPGAVARAADVEGVVGRITFDAARERTVEAPVDGVSVVLEGEGARLEARTGRDGRFSLAGVPAGTYRVFTTPRTDEAAPDDGQVTVPERGCARLALTVLARGVLVGRVVDHLGAPVAGVDVVIAPEGRSLTSSNYWVRRTDASGAFRFENMPAGRYNAGVEIASPTYGPGAYGPVFYPGVRERPRAATVVLAEERAADAGTLRLPPELPTRAVEGRVVARGPLPDRVRVRVRNTRAIEGASHSVDADRDGQFRFVALEGETYVVEATSDGRASRPLHLKVEGHRSDLSLELP